LDKECDARRMEFPGRAGLAVWITALVLAQCRGRVEKEMRMQFPSYEELPMSPRLDKPGIKVLLGASSFKANEPVALYGTFVSDAAFYDKCRVRKTPGSR